MLAVQFVTRLFMMVEGNIIEAHIPAARIMTLIAINH